MLNTFTSPYIVFPAYMPTRTEFMWQSKGNTPGPKTWTCPPILALF